MEWIGTSTRHSDLYRFVGVFIISARKTEKVIGF